MDTDQFLVDILIRMVEPNMAPIFQTNNGVFSLVGSFSIGEDEFVGVFHFTKSSLFSVTLPTDPATPIPIDSADGIYALFSVTEEESASECIAFREEGYEDGYAVYVNGTLNGLWKSKPGSSFCTTAVCQLSMDETPIAQGTMVLMENELRILDETFTCFSYPIETRNSRIQSISLYGVQYMLVSSEQVDGEDHAIFQ